MAPTASKVQKGAAAPRDTAQHASPGRERSARQADTPDTRLTSLAVKRAREGDPAALAFLCTRYAENVQGYVHGIVQDRARAEEVTEHLFAALPRTIGSYEEHGTPFLAWLLRRAGDLALDRVRRRRKLSVRQTDDADQPFEDATGRESDERANGSHGKRRAIRPLSTSAR